MGIHKNINGGFWTPTRDVPTFSKYKINFIFSATHYGCIFDTINPSIEPEYRVDFASARLLKPIIIAL